MRGIAERANLYEEKALPEEEDLIVSEPRLGQPLWAGAYHGGFQ